MTQDLVKGQASVSESFGANSLYHVTLVTSAGKQLLQFPITTALINPVNLRRAQLDLVCRKADNSLKSAQVSVLMRF